MKFGFYLSFVMALILSSCIGLPPKMHSEIYINSISIYNATNEKLRYRVLFNSTSTNWREINSKNGDLIDSFYTNKISTQFPKGLKQLNIRLTNCQLILKEKEIEDNFTLLNDNGGILWEIVINKALIKKIGCVN